MTVKRTRQGPGLGDNAYLLLATASLFWSGNHIIGRAIAGEVPPLAVSTIRWLIPMILLWPFARRHLRRDWPLVAGHRWTLLFLGVSGGAIFSALQYVGLQYTTAMNTSVLNSMAPVLIVAAGAMLFRDRIGPIQLSGIAISLTGVLVIVTQADIQKIISLQINSGDLIILANMCVWAVYATCLRLRPDIHWLSFTFLLAAISSLGTLPFAVWEHLEGFTVKPTLLTFATFAYVAIFPSVISFACWNRGVEIIGANQAGVFLHLIPLYSAVLASLLLGESLMIYHVGGFVFILAGVWMASKPRQALQAPRKP